MKLLHKNGTTGVILRVKIIDATSASAAGKTGLTSSSAGLVISTLASTEAVATVYAQAAGTIEAITTLGTYAAPSASKCRFREVDASNHPGLYELQLADARFNVAGARHLIVSISGASSAVQCDAEVQLVALDFYDATRAGLTALPAAAASSAGGLPTIGSGAGQIALDGSGNVSSQMIRDLIEADRVVDTTVAPWALVLIKKGSGALGQPGAIELLRQKLYDVTGGGITNSNTILGRSIT
ncbi:MAG TPA: hypothetical protein VHV08_06315 [Pirellulales bacterium]|jgi:hypothetical protein|nr:hypothetical protein [Pirellulales bacterium]